MLILFWGLGGPPPAHTRARLGSAAGGRHELTVCEPVKGPVARPPVSFGALFCLPAAVARPAGRHAAGRRLAPGSRAGCVVGGGYGGQGGGRGGEGGHAATAIAVASVSLPGAQYRSRCGGSGGGGGAREGGCEKMEVRGGGVAGGGPGGAYGGEACAAACLNHR